MNSTINKPIHPITGKEISVKDTVLEILNDIWVGTFGRETSSENAINIQKAIFSNKENHSILLKELNNRNNTDGINIIKIKLEKDNTINFSIVDTKSKITLEDK